MNPDAATALPLLTRETLLDDPIAQFLRWFDDAAMLSGLRDPNAMCLSTVGEDGFPQGRVVLLKGVQEGGFVFYTNLRSDKARALTAHPRAALTFHWERLGRQVRVQGTVEGVSEADADAYFASRPRESRIGAWASEQSAPLVGREELEVRVRELEARWPGDDIPRPPYWGGYRVIPRAIEFWQERPGRLHDRFVYRRDPLGGWSVTRLNP